MQKKQDLEKEKDEKIKKVLQKVEQRSSASPDLAATKAKRHLEKVEKVVSAQKEKQATEQEEKKSKFEMKLTKAEERRGCVLNKVKQTAQEVGQGRSKSKQ